MSAGVRDLTTTSSPSPSVDMAETVSKKPSITRLESPIKVEVSYLSNFERVQE